MQSFLPAQYREWEGVSLLLAKDRQVRGGHRQQDQLQEVQVPEVS